jgi:hypothetical protein
MPESVPGSERNGRHQDVKDGSRPKPSPPDSPPQIRPKAIDTKVFKILVDQGGHLTVLTRPLDLDFDRKHAPDLSAPKLSGKSVTLTLELDEKSALFRYEVRHYPESGSERLWDDRILAFIRGAGWKRMDGNDYHRKFDLEISFVPMDQ